MKQLRITAFVAGALALSAAPAFAAGPPAGTPGAGHGGAAGQTTATDDATAGLPAKAKAYGRYCKGQSRKRVKGEKGTPFSRCVTAMAAIATDATDSPRAACKGLSRKHVKGERGTPFSRCVVAAAKLLKEQKAQEDEDATADEDTPATDPQPES